MKIHIFLLALFVFTFPFSAKADPRCGNVEEDVVEDVFDAADNIDFHYDVEDDLEEICSVAQSLRKWEREQPREVKDKAYKKERDDIISCIEDEMKEMRASLIFLNGWIHHDAKGSTAKAIRYAKIKRAKKEIQSNLEDLEKQVQRIRKLKEERQN